jgi:hypothetical protein
VLARFRLARHSALDELGNYTQAEPAFRSSQLRKSCSVTPSFACIEPRCVRSEHADAARTAGPAASPLDDLRKYRCVLLDVESRLPQVVHSTSPAPAAPRARVAGGAEEPLLARHIRSSQCRRQDAYATPRRRRTRTRSRRLSLRLREQLCSPGERRAVGARRERAESRTTAARCQTKRVGPTQCALSVRATRCVIGGFSS